MSYVRLGWSVSFTAGIYVNNKVTMNTFGIDMQMMTLTTNSSDHDIGLDRLKYIVLQFNNSIFVNQDDTKAIDQFTKAGFNVISLPSEPCEQIVGLALFYKLNSILEGQIQVLDVNISSSGSTITYLHNDEEEPGPFEDEGWWTASDPNCYANLNNKVVALNHTWKALELHWDSYDAPEEPDIEEISIELTLEPNPKENVVAFKPKDDKK